MEPHLTTTECLLLYGITQCYLPPDTSKLTCNSPYLGSVCFFWCFWCVFSCLFWAVSTSATDCLERLVSKMCLIHSFIHSFISGMHHYQCVAPNVDINLQSGRFWATSVASFRQRSIDFRSCWVVFIHVVWGRPGGLLQFSKGEAVKISFEVKLYSFVWLQQNVAATSSDGVPQCKYGADCYQQNPEHRRNFSHPPPAPPQTTSKPAEASCQQSSGADNHVTNNTQVQSR